jgi:hypothetical protein
MHLIQASAAGDEPVTVMPIEGAGHGSVERFQEHAETLVAFISANLESRK